MFSGERSSRVPRFASQSADSSWWSGVLPQRPRRVEILAEAARTLPRLELNATKCEKSPRKPVVTSQLAGGRDARRDSEKLDESEALLAVQYIQLLNAVFRFHLQSMDAAAGARSSRSYLEGQMQNEEYRLERSTESIASRQNTDVMTRQAYKKYASKSAPNFADLSEVTPRLTHNTPEPAQQWRPTKSTDREDVVRPKAASSDVTARRHIRVYLPPVHTHNTLTPELSFESSDCDADSLVVFDDDVSDVDECLTSRFADDEASDVTTHSSDDIFDSCETFRSKFHLPTIDERSELTSASSSVVTSRCSSRLSDFIPFDFALAPCNTFIVDSPEKSAPREKAMRKCEGRPRQERRRKRKQRVEQLQYVDSLQVVRRSPPRVRCAVAC